VNTPPADDDEPCCTDFDRTCTCQDCQEHGEITGMWGNNMTHQVYRREDGTAWAWMDWSPVKRRRMVQLRENRDGILVPVDRGERGDQVRQDMAPLIPMAPSGQRSGRDPGFGAAADDVVPKVQALLDAAHARGERLPIEDACIQVAVETGWSEDTVLKLFYRDRRRDQ
jgi:hypothetical protein